jgi:hypothetical protein
MPSRKKSHKRKSPSKQELSRISRACGDKRLIYCGFIEGRHIFKGRGKYPYQYATKGGKCYYMTKNTFRLERKHDRERKRSRRISRR